MRIRVRERGRERQRGRAGCESAVTTEGSGSEKFKYKHGRTTLTRRGRQTYLHCQTTVNLIALIILTPPVWIEN